MCFLSRQVRAASVVSDDGSPGAPKFMFESISTASFASYFSASGSVFFSSRLFRAYRHLHAKTVDTTRRTNRMTTSIERINGSTRLSEGHGGHSLTGASKRAS